MNELRSKREQNRHCLEVARLLIVPSCQLVVKLDFMCVRCRVLKVSLMQAVSFSLKVGQSLLKSLS